MLSSSHFSFVEARSLSEALKHAREEPVDVVLLDLSLPDSNGLETLHNLVSARKDLPIVVLTGIEDITFAIEALRVGAHDYIVKSRLSADALTRSINLAIAAKQRQLVEEKLIQRTKLSALSSDVGKALVQSRSLRTMLQGCTDAMVEHLDAAFARIWTADSTGDTLILQASSGLYTHIDGEHGRIPVGQYKVGLIASERTPHLTNTVLEDERLSDKEWAAREGMVSFAGHPLLVGNRLVGVMGMFSRQKLHNVTISALSAVADQIAIGIDRFIAESERALLASIVQQSEDGIIRQNLDGVVLSWNPAAERIYGLSAKKMIGSEISKLMPNGQTPFPAGSTIEGFGEHSLIGHLEQSQLRGDGGVIDLSITLSRIRDNTGETAAVSAIIRDITRQKQLERIKLAQLEVTRILSASESLADAAPAILQQLGQSVSSEFCALWDLQRGEKFLRCVDLWHIHDSSLVDLAAITRHIKFTEGATLPGRVLASGKPAWIANLSKDVGYARKTAALSGGLKSAIAGPIYQGGELLGVIEMYFRHHECPEEDFFSALSSTGAQIGQFINRKYAEDSAKQAALAQQKISQAIVENAPIGIVRLDKNLVILDANPSFCQLFELDCANLAGKFIFQIPTIIPNQQLMEVAQKGVSKSATNLRIMKSEEQSTVFVDLAIWPVKADDNKVVGLVILVADVSERVKLAEQREDFVATLTHDLKNPLIGENRLLDSILSDRFGPLNDDLRKMLSVIKNNTSELLALIGTLLDVYRYDQGIPRLACKEFDWQDVIDSYVAEMSPVAAIRSIQIDVSYQEGLPSMHGDKMALRRVVMNLLDNGVKFTPDGGLIELSCRFSDTEFILTVEDSGPGISDTELEYLFQRFAQTERGAAYKDGIGLGLYLCRQIVEAHGGEIFYSKGERGAKFMIKLPLKSHNCISD